MQVGLFHPTIHPDAMAAATQVANSGWIGMGRRVAEFEIAFCEYLGLSDARAASGAPRAAVAVSTCTAALHLALRLLHLEKGSQVITSPVTFAATSQTILWEGLTPVFADVDRDTGLLSPESVEACITERTGALMAVHLGGRPCDMNRLMSIARRHHLHIVEDAAHACGARYETAATDPSIAVTDGRRVGSSGNLCAFSFGPTKALTTVDGGMLTGLDERQLEEARKVRVMGMSKDAFRRVADTAGNSPRFWDYDIDTLGLRCHMNDVTAALGLVHLRQLDERNARRAALVETYNNALAGIPGIKTLPQSPASSNYLYWVLADRRDALAVALRDRGVTTGVYYKPNTHYGLFAQYTGPAGTRHWPGAEAFFNRQLCLPLFADMTAEQLHFVVDAIAKGW